MTSGGLLAAALTALGLCACTASTPSGRSVGARDSAIAALHTRKCGKCHKPPEPQSRARDQLEAALRRHKDRVHLSTAQWAAMLDYLAPGPEGEKSSGR